MEYLVNMGTNLAKYGNLPNYFFPTWQNGLIPIINYILNFQITCLTATIKNILLKISSKYGQNIVYFKINQTKTISPYLMVVPKLLEFLFYSACNRRTAEYKIIQYLKKALFLQIKVLFTSITCIQMYEFYLFFTMHTLLLKLKY